MKSAALFFLILTICVSSTPRLEAQVADPLSPLYAPIPEKAFVAEASSGQTAVSPTAGLSTRSVTALPGSPLPHVMNGSSAATTISSSSGQVKTQYDVTGAGSVSGVTVDFDDHGTPGKETANLSTLSKITAGLAGTVNAVNVAFVDANGNTVALQLTGASSSERFWNIDLALLGSNLGRSHISAIHFYVDTTTVDASRRAGTFSIRLTGWDTSKPGAPLLSPQVPLQTNLYSFTLTGTKGAYCSVSINGKLTVPADSSTAWSASVILKKEGNNSFSLVSKNALGVSSATRKVTILCDRSSPKGSIQINRGAASTNASTVTLTLSASDKMTGVDMMCFSIDGGTYSAWEPFAATKNITLTSFGTTHISYWVRDKAGNISFYYDTIVNASPEALQALSQALENLLTKPGIPSGYNDALFQQRMDFQQKLAGFTAAQRTALFSQLSSRDQALLKMLTATKLAVPNFITDYDLENLANRKLIASSGFNSPDFRNNLGVLESMDPQSAAAFIGLLVTPQLKEAGALTSWASQSWAMVMMDARYNDFATNSTLGKLLVRNQVMPIRTSTHAYLGWSGKPSVWISLPPVVIGAGDVPDLTRIRDAGREPYRSWAITALAGL